jgi:integrase
MEIFFGKNGLDGLRFLVYFYTTMQHETIRINSPLPHTYAIITTLASSAASNDNGGDSNNVIARRSCSALDTKLESGRAPRSLTSNSYKKVARQPRSRGTLTRSLELLLGSLRGEALVVAMLAYGLGFRVSELRSLRVRDVCLKDKSIFILGRYRKLPEVALEDLREHLHDRICGREAPGGVSGGSSDDVWHRDDLLFSPGAFNALCEACQTFYERSVGDEFLTRRGSLTDCLDSVLKVLGWLHRRCSAKCGIACESPLDLFSKGPRIVRRGRGGAVDAYYVWRASRELF